MPIKNEMVLFERCSGLNQVDPDITYENATVELRECKGISLTAKAKIVNDFGLVPCSEEATSDILVFSGYRRFICQIGTGVYIYNFGTFSRVQYLGDDLEVVGTVSFVHTELDIRFVSDNVVYIVINGSINAFAAVVGVYGGPSTSITFAAMPVFDSGFLYNSRVYIFKDTYMMYSEQWYYDCFDLGNSAISFGDTVLEGAAITGCIVVLCENKVVVLRGEGPGNFQYTEHSIKPKRGSLATGYVTGVGSTVVFIADSDIYSVTSDGILSKLTYQKFEDLSEISCYSAVIDNEVDYKVSTSIGVIKFDFLNKCPIMGYDFKVLFAKVGNFILTARENLVNIFERNVPGSLLICFPYLDYNSSFRKKIRRIRMFGKFFGALTLTVENREGKSETYTYICAKEEEIVEFTGFGKIVGEYLSLSIEFYGSIFELQRVKGTSYIVY